jgi:hypothetical protein
MNVAGKSFLRTPEDDHVYGDSRTRPATFLHTTPHVTFVLERDAYVAGLAIRL